MSYYPGHPYYDGEGSKLARKTGTLIARKLPQDGNRSWSVTVEPLEEPVTATELKTFARIDTTEEDTLIESFITACRRAAEDYTGRAFVQQTLRTVLDFWPGRVFEMPKPPLMSVSSIVTIDEDDAETTYSSSNYYVDTTATPGRLIIKRDVTEPVNTDRDYARFAITSKHGYGVTADDVPSDIKNAVMLWVAALYEERTIDPKKPPPVAKGLLDFYRITKVLIR